MKVEFLYKSVRYSLAKIKSGKVKDLARCLYMRRSSLYDAKWYVEKYPEVKDSPFPPIAHYFEVGWKKGYNPSENFSTTEYLKGVRSDRIKEACPLLFYLRHDQNRAVSGVNNMRLSELFSPKAIDFGRFVNRKLIEKNRNAAIFVHVHVFYPDMWPAVRRYLEVLSCYNFKLVVTYPPGFVGEKALATIKADFPECELIMSENKGFDVGPFMEVLSHLDLDKYDIVYHLHTKSISFGLKGRPAYGKYFKGSEWFRQLYDGCLGPMTAHRVIDALMNKPDISLAAARNLVFHDVPHREAFVRRYASMMGVEVPQEYTFIGGFCFAAKASALKKVAALGIDLESFGQSRRALFTLAHALERLIPILLTSAQGMRLMTVRTSAPKHLLLGALHVFLASWKYMSAARVLAKEGFEKVARFGIDTRSGLKIMFLEGYFNGNKCFIKLGGHQEIVENEACMQSRMHELLPEYVPAVHTYDKKRRYIAMDCVPGYNLDMLMQTGITAEEKAGILRDLEIIRGKIVHSGYIHRDIMPANFIWNGERLQLVDFQFMVEVDKETGLLKELQYVAKRPAVQAGLGNAYRKPGEGWDDDYSFDRVVEFVNEIRVCKYI